MPEAVADTPVEESQETTEETPESTATPEGEDAATLKRRLAGKDQALTKTQKERDALKAQFDEVQKRLLEREQADMSEVDRLKLERDQAKDDAAAARAEATKARLARDFPLAVEFYGDEPLPSEERLSSLEKRLAAKSEDETEDEPRIDPNRPRRTTAPTSPREMSAEDLEKQLARTPPPWG